MQKTNNPFEVRQRGNQIEFWYGPPGKPESEFIMQVSIDWIPQIIETLQKLQGKQS